MLQVTKGLGAVATVIVRKGILKPGDPIVVGTEFGKIRLLKDSRGQTLSQAGPGQAVVVSGLRGVPSAGDEICVVGSESRASKMASARAARSEEFRLGQLARMQAEHNRRTQQLREQEYERWDCGSWFQTPIIPASEHAFLSNHGCIMRIMRLTV